ncbi:putative nuclease HARBI1, partial [Maniola jurtina]|uniref:putative nuclease HARBI1 n=1 Tax=Maniola jurtina TaxID=191418 RepID=UPI001E6884F5
RLRDMYNPMELPETEFIANFRLSKAGYQQVLEELGPHLQAARRRTAVRIELKILAALHFYATGTYQRPIGTSIFNTMSQPCFSRCLREVTDALNAREVLTKYIKFPASQRERETIMQNFMEKFGFPGIIGCIDGTHVALVRPIEHEESFLNRKFYHSSNVMIICDANLSILHVDASFGGASHDSFVWNNSMVKTIMEGLTNERCWLLGDSGYAQRPWMMTPILDAAAGSPEEHYTKLHCRVRNSVERCIGVLKARWRCLLSHRVLHYDPVVAAKVVNACVCLHNIANVRNVPIPEDDSGEGGDNQQPQQALETPDAANADSTRAMLVRRLWDARP